MFVTGIVLKGRAEAADQHASWWVLLLYEGSAVTLAVALIHLVYEFAIHREFELEIDKLGQTVQGLQRTVFIAQGAVESGLSAVYSIRDEVNEDIATLMANLRERKQSGKLPRSESPDVRLIGISLGAFLCPHGALHGSFRDLLTDEDISVEAILLDDGSDEAIVRARPSELSQTSGSHGGFCSWDWSISSEWAWRLWNSVT